VEREFNHNAHLPCLPTIDHLHYPQPDEIKENGSGMGEHPLEAPALPVFGLYVNALNYRARCRASPDDFYLKEAKCLQIREQAAVLQPCRCGGPGRRKQTNISVQAGDRSPGTRMQHDRRNV